MSKLIIGKRYVVWDMYRQRVVWGYYVDNHETDVTQPSQSWTNVVFKPAYVFALSDISRKSRKKILARNVQKVAFNACQIICCLDDMYLDYLPLEEGE